MKRILLVLAAMALALLLASGVAWAVTKIGTDGPDTLRGTNGDDNLIGKGGNDRLSGCVAATPSWAGRARIGLIPIHSGCQRGCAQARRTCLVVPATI